MSHPAFLAPRSDPAGQRSMPAREPHEEPVRDAEHTHHPQERLDRACGIAFERAQRRVADPRHFGELPLRVRLGKPFPPQKHRKTHLLARDELVEGFVHLGF